MDYSNPQLPEGINVSKRHPLAELGILLGGSLAVLLLLVVVLSLMSRTLAGWIPFSIEQRLAEQVSLPVTVVDDARARPYQQLAERLASHMDLPEDMAIRVYLSASQTPNAFATLGGQIVLFQGLIDRVDSENALALVLAHEIAHVRERHPISSMGQTLVIGLGLMAVTGISSDRMLQRLIELVGGLTLLGYSREQERAADHLALAAVAAEYGHVSGASTFFEQMLDEQDDRWLEFTNTHPLTQARIEALQQQAQRQGWPEQGDLTPLP